MNNKQKKYISICYQKCVVLTKSAFKNLCLCCNLTTLIWYLQDDIPIKKYVEKFDF